MFKITNGGAGFKAAPTIVISGIGSIPFQLTCTIAGGITNVLFLFVVLLVLVILQ